MLRAARVAATPAGAQRVCARRVFARGAPPTPPARRGAGAARGVALRWHAPLHLATLADTDPAAAALVLRNWPAPRRRASGRSHAARVAASADTLGALAAAWEATQRVTMYATAAGLAAAALVATTARGRHALRTGWAEFQRSPEGAQAASLVHYLLLVLAARCLEVLTGAKGLLTFVYLGIAAQQLLLWFRTGLPGPEEARARVLALEAGLPYAPPPPPEAEVVLRAAFPELAGEALVHAARCSLAAGPRAGAGWALLTAHVVAFAGDADGASSSPPPLRMLLPLADCVSAGPAPDGSDALLLQPRGGEGEPLVRLTPLPPATPPARRPVSLAAVVAGYWEKAAAPAAPAAPPAAA